MTWYDWLIVIVPTAFVMGLGFYSRKYIRGVSDFLTAGRCAGRYILTMGDVANGLALTTLIAFVETNYKAGFAVGFWGNLAAPIWIVMGLFGFVTYRYRQTKVMSIGQFLELRYNRPFRVFASFLRAVSEILANMIMPALAARFFIYFLDLPRSIHIAGYAVPTFLILIILCLTLAISLLCFGGTLSMLIADAVQGMAFFPLMIVVIVFILWKFNWSQEIIPVMADRVSGESFLNSFDIKNLRDFNLFMIFIGIFSAIFHRADWIGGGYCSAAKSAHEQKMAGILGTWRDALSWMFYVLIALGLITVMNHQNFSGTAKDIKVTLSRKIAEEIVAPMQQDDFIRKIEAVPEQKHRIGIDEPLSHKKDLDTPYMDTAQKALQEYEGESKGNAKFQEYRTLYYQLMTATGMRKLLPPVFMGLFCLLMVLSMISTDDTRIYSASSTVVQDVILPFYKKPPSMKTHIWLLRWVSIGIGVAYAIGSLFMAQLDYINLFVSIMCSMWTGGCAPVLMFGLYSRWGNAYAAFASLISGMVLALGTIFIQRNWADVVYPFLANHGWAEPVGRFLETVSSPFHPYVVWKMDPVKFPINAYEIFLLINIITLIIFVAVTLLTQRTPFNLDRMLHRGIYRDENEPVPVREKVTFRWILSRMVGITQEYSRGDRIIAWSVFFYSFLYSFLGAFVLVAVWNVITPWPIAWWGTYFFITTLLIPIVVAAISTFWFGIGGVVDLFRLFRDLNNRKFVDELDNGQVEGNVSLSDKARFDRLEAEQKESK